MRVSAGSSQRYGNILVFDLYVLDAADVASPRPCTWNPVNGPLVPADVQSVPGVRGWRLPDAGVGEVAIYTDRHHVARLHHMNLVPFAIAQREFVAQFEAGLEWAPSVLDPGHHFILEQLHDHEVLSTVHAEQQSGRVAWLHVHRDRDLVANNETGVELQIAAVSVVSRTEVDTVFYVVDTSQRVDAVQNVRHVLSVHHEALEAALKGLVEAHALVVIRGNIPESPVVERRGEYRRLVAGHARVAYMLAVHGQLAVAIVSYDGSRVPLCVVVELRRRHGRGAVAAVERQVELCIFHVDGKELFRRCIRGRIEYESAVFVEGPEANGQVEAFQLSARECRVLNATVVA